MKLQRAKDEKKTFPSFRNSLLTDIMFNSKNESRGVKCSATKRKMLGEHQPLDTYYGMWEEYRNVTF